MTECIIIFSYLFCFGLSILTDNNVILSLYFEGHYVWRNTAVIHVVVCNLGIFYSLSVLFGNEISVKNPLEYEEGR